MSEQQQIREQAEELSRQFDEMILREHKQMTDDLREAVRLLKRVPDTCDERGEGIDSYECQCLVVDVETFLARISRNEKTGGE